jgi:hypothetical protein
MNALDFTLTKEQTEEFDHILLQNFAKAYLNFIHSSPATTNRKSFRYFMPLSEKDLDEKYILYGKNREETYEDLIFVFNMCIQNKMFDRYFDDNHTLYWQSKTIPKLIIKKEWI